MKVIIKHTGQDAATAAAASIAGWEWEHERYYASQPRPKSGWLDMAGFNEIEDIGAGFVGGNLARLAMIKVVEDGHLTYPWSKILDYALGAQAAGGWCTCTGNLTLAVVAGDCVIEYRRGFRHGVRHAAPCRWRGGWFSSWLYFLSRREDTSPDEKGLTDPDPQP